ncbi:hypothetical protein VP01_2657g2 [Puccinia sorghi]|uniref:Uncharacterized protein n=1 Tax=Puccinia sorghi TaxID=27349 RepID=A0A0L6V468_9BASI|nr:hypothetical protein VP01_2657g2 [Puccinia sorghi]
MKDFQFPRFLNLEILDLNSKICLIKVRFFCNLDLAHLDQAIQTYRKLFFIFQCYQYGDSFYNSKLITTETNFPEKHHAKCLGKKWRCDINHNESFINWEINRIKNKYDKLKVEEIYKMEEEQGNRGQWNYLKGDTEIKASEFLIPHSINMFRECDFFLLDNEFIVYFLKVVFKKPTWLKFYQFIWLTSNQVKTGLIKINYLLLTIRKSSANCGLWADILKYIPSFANLMRGPSIMPLVLSVTFIQKSLSLDQNGVLVGNKYEGSEIFKGEENFRKRQRRERKLEISICPHPIPGLPEPAVSSSSFLIFSFSQLESVSVQAVCAIRRSTRTSRVKLIHESEWIRIMETVADLLSWMRTDQACF